MKNISISMVGDVVAIKIDDLSVSADRAALCVAACAGIPDYQLKGENSAPVKLGEVIDHLRNQVGLTAEHHPLQTIFDQCVEQAVSGKGEERHGHGAPFMEQPWHQITERQGIGFLVGQAEKKIGEATAFLQQNPGPDGVAFWQKEIRGAMNYLGMSMLYIEEQVAELTSQNSGCSGCAGGCSADPLGMKFDPVTGSPFFPGPYKPEEYRAHHGEVAWLFNPWTGEPRDPRDVGSDPHGHLVVPF